MKTAQIDSRIGALGNGQFYAFVHGYDKPETVGTLEEVEHALGIAKSHDAAQVCRKFDVVMCFDHPAWDEVDGISYPGIKAKNKTEANNLARGQARRDGHTIGRGRYWFTATEV